MSAPPASQGEPITDRRQLVDYLASGCKPRDAWRIGTEHEKFMFRRDDLRRLPHDGDGPTIRKVLEGLTRFGWETVLENGLPIALRRGDCNVTLEPGGQFELSGAPLETIHQTCDETSQHLEECLKVTGEMGVGMLGMGFDPKWPRAEVPWMPKGRYRIMRAHMARKGTLGQDMMLRTCTVQVNLDHESEADMVRKFRVSLALQPVATALFADSPFVDGKPSGFLSFRSQVWTDTDPDRTGLLPFVFDAGFGFERYVDYILDVPMYFVYRNGAYIDASGQSFRDFMAGRLPALPGAIPGLGDFADHLTTAFPEVRLKKYLEMRGADGGPWGRLCALPALWVGLLYDSVALDAADQLVKEWNVADHDALRRAVPRTALRTPFRGGTVQDVARRMVTIAQEGLKRRNRRDRRGVRDEAYFLDPIAAIAESGRSPAEDKLEKFATVWGGSVDPVFREFAY